jgi:hypothetical protein
MYINFLLVLKDIRKDNGENSINQGSNKFMSRISTNTHLDELDKLLESGEGLKIKNSNLSPARTKKIIEPNNSFLFNKDHFGYKGAINGTLGNGRPIQPIVPSSNYSNSLKVESPFRKKEDKNDIIDRIINEHKDKFSDPFDFSHQDKNKSSGARDARPNRVNEKDFEYFESDKKKYGINTNINNVRRKSGVKAKEDFNENKMIKVDFESRRRNKVNEVLDKDNFDSFERKMGNEYKKPGAVNYGNFNYGKKDNENYFYQKY